MCWIWIVKVVRRSILLERRCWPCKNYEKAKEWAIRADLTNVEAKGLCAYKAYIYGDQ